ncbi:hypothetical protein BANRA_00533 [Acinetobacter baumannii]|nr:hypothetical protein BANRA_00533 [Acinetobacter baumannii]
MNVEHLREFYGVENNSQLAKKIKKHAQVLPNGSEKAYHQERKLPLKY